MCPSIIIINIYFLQFTYKWKLYILCIFKHCSLLFMSKSILLLSSCLLISHDWLDVNVNRPNDFVIQIEYTINLFLKITIAFACKSSGVATIAHSKSDLVQQLIVINKLTTFIPPDQILSLRCSYSRMNHTKHKKSLSTYLNPRNYVRSYPLKSVAVLSWRNCPQQEPISLTCYIVEDANSSWWSRNIYLKCAFNMI